MYRGSRKHVLDWTGIREFAGEFAAMLSPIKVRLTEQSKWKPRGEAVPTEARLERFGPDVLPNRAVWRELREWWLAESRGANTPNWDIALNCEIEERPGFVLVEAKANVPELGSSGKPLHVNASQRSRANHVRIGMAIEEARVGLHALGFPLEISRDTHYQLSNRIAFTWKLASLGIPTVLIYLGFTGDTGIADAGEPFRDDSHWREVLGAYMSNVNCASLFERRIDVGAAPAWMSIRSRSVLSASSPAYGRIGPSSDNSL
jgi:hypothetical protein